MNKFDFSKVLPVQNSGFEGPRGSIREEFRAYFGSFKPLSKAARTHKQ